MDQKKISEIRKLYYQDHYEGMAQLFTATEDSDIWKDTLSSAGELEEWRSVHLGFHMTGSNGGGFVEIGYLPKTEQFACAYLCGYNQSNGCDLFDSISEVESCISNLGICPEEIEKSIVKFNELQADLSKTMDIMNAIDDVEKLEEMYQIHGDEAVNHAIDLLDKYNRSLESEENPSLEKQDGFEVERENMLLESEWTMDMTLSR